MFIDTVRISEQAKNQLIKLKRKTKIENWNVLCRWALCLSLADPKPVTEKEIITNSSVEMTWKVFGGEYHKIYEALLKERCYQDRIVLSKKNLSKQFKLHLHRGISYLDNSSKIKGIATFLNMSIQQE